MQNRFTKWFLCYANKQSIHKVESLDNIIISRCYEILPRYVIFIFKAHEKFLKSALIAFSQRQGLLTISFCLRTKHLLCTRPESKISRFKCLMCYPITWLWSDNISFLLINQGFLRLFLLVKIIPCFQNRTRVSEWRGFLHFSCRTFIRK